MEWLGFGVSVAGELGDGKQREHDAAKFERRELAVVDDLWPAEVAVEVAEAGEIAGAEGDQIGEGADVFMAEVWAGRVAVWQTVGSPVRTQSAGASPTPLNPRHFSAVYSVVPVRITIV